MKTFFCFLVIGLIGFEIRAQNNCETNLLNDTMSVFDNGKIIEGTYVETTLKKGAVVRFLKTTTDKFYMRILVTENFYFDKKDVLEIKSGNKSFYGNDIKQYKVNKHMGLFILEIPKNYISQLKDEGVTALVFANTETDFTKGDTKQIKQICTCFYNTILNKNK